MLNPAPTPPPSKGNASPASRLVNISLCVLWVLVWAWLHKPMITKFSIDNALPLKSFVATLVFLGVFFGPARAWQEACLVASDWKHIGHFFACHFWTADPQTRMLETMQSLCTLLSYTMNYGVLSPTMFGIFTQSLLR
jgi:hypothetical protein